MPRPTECRQNLSRRRLAGLGLTVFASVLASCNSSMSGLDRGHVSVAGLSKAPTSAAVNSPKPSLLTLANIQTRQTATIALAPSLVNQGRYLSLARTQPMPPAEIFNGVAFPTPNDPVTSSDVTLTLGADGGVIASFYADTLVHSNGLVYGQNTLEFTVSDNGDTTAIENVTITLFDFAVSSVALTSFPTGGQVSEDGTSQGWVSMLATPSVSEQNPGANPTTLHSEMLNMINP